MRLFACAVGAAMLGMVAACSGPEEPPIGLPVRGVTSGKAAKALDASGHFVLPGGQPGELTGTQAQELARVYGRTAGRWLQNAWEGDRGSSIDVDKLVPCGRAFYARSPFDQSGLKTDGNAIRTLFGPKWLVTLCGEDGSGQVSVAVSALATQLQISRGSIRGLQAGDFVAFGIPQGIPSVPPQPEAIASVVASQTGSRLVDVPELVLPPPPYVAQLARWRVVLQSPVVAASQSNGGKLTTREVYYGFGDTWNTTGLLVGTRRSEPASGHDPERDGSAFTLIPVSGYSDAYEHITVERP